MIAVIMVMTVVLVPQGGVLLRSFNKLKPLYDYSFFLGVLSFDYLLLDSFKHSNPLGEGILSIYMVVVGGFFTAAMGVFCLPQYAGA